MIGIATGIPGTSRAPSAWTPWAALGGQWWDAAEGMTGSPVSAWAARGGTATATQGTVANQPAAPATNVNLGGEFASAFDGTDTVVSGTALDMSAAWTVATVLRFGSLRSHTGVFRLSAGELTGADGLALYADSTGRLNVASADASAWYRLGPTSTVASNTSYAILERVDCAASRRDQRRLDYVVDGHARVACRDVRDASGIRALCAAGRRLGGCVVAPRR
jgi:hypothetical protein